MGSSAAFLINNGADFLIGPNLGNYLMGALPEATYIGFTGTPIDRTAYGKGTFKTFGTDDEKGYLDKYSIRESVEDGTTVPLHYTLAPNDYEGRIQTVTVSPGGPTTISWPADQYGYYDVVITASTADGFRRRYAGRVA